MTHSSAIIRRTTLSIAVAAFSMMVAASGCSKKTAPETSDTPNGPSVEENVMGDSDSGKAMGLQTVHFPYDSFTLDGEGKSALKNNADIMKSKTSVKIQIEGHCDQRGGIQYNIALGEKRANTAKNFLVDMGVSGDRITTISYGKERPIDPSENEAAYSKNRRANFVITAR